MTTTIDSVFTTSILADVVEKLSPRYFPKNGRGVLLMVAQRLRELDKPDCIYTLCADDSPTPQTLESACGGAMWYLGDDGKGAYPKFCHHCQGAVVVKEST